MIDQRHTFDSISRMARPRSNEKRNAILAAAIRVIDAQGLNASTLSIAKEAGVSNGTLFVYFATKTELYNCLYLDIKSGMASAIMNELSPKADLRKQLSQAWSNWMAWATADPARRRTLLLLKTSDELTAETHAAGMRVMADAGALFEKVRQKGSMRDAPIVFLGTIVDSLAETTMTFMIQDPKNADKHCKTGFEAAWRVLN